MGAVAVLLLACGGGGSPDPEPFPEPEPPVAPVPESLPPPSQPPAPPREPPPPISAPQPVPCGLQPAATQWTLERDALTVKLSCAAGAALPPDLVLGPLPDGASWDAAAGTITWTPRLDQAGAWEIAATLPSTGESANVRIGVVDRFDASGNVPPDPARYLEEYGLPVFHLRTQGSLSRDAWRPVTVTYRGRTWRAEAQIRGVTSSHYPKKGWNVRFPDADRFDAPELEMRLRKKIVLIADFDDASHLRNRLSYELWRRMDPRNLWLVHHSAVVWLDGRYHGLYTLTEKVAGQFLSRHGLSGDGNLYKAVEHDANFDLVGRDGHVKSPLSEGFTKEEGTPLQGEPGAFDDLEELIDFVARSTGQAFRDGFPRRVRLEDYLSWWAFDLASYASDGMAKNAFHYHDPAGGPWRMLPWDFNATFGQTYQTLRAGPRSSDEFGGWNEIFDRVLDDSVLGPRAREHLGRTVACTVPATGMLSLLDELAAEVRAGALRDARRWAATQREWFALPENGGRADWTEFEAEVRYVRDWISRRWAYLAPRYPVTCDPAQPSG